MTVKTATPGKVFAYLDKEGKEIILGTVMYLGANDDGSRYYEIRKPKKTTEEVK